jgi:hypothetical protein
MAKINEENISSWEASNRKLELTDLYLYNRVLALISQYHHVEAAVLCRSIEIRALEVENECLNLKIEKEVEELEQIKENENKMQNILDKVAPQIKLMDSLY